MPKTFCRESCVCVTRDKKGQFKRVVPDTKCSILFPRTPKIARKTAAPLPKRPKHPIKEVRKPAPTVKTGAKVDLSKCVGWGKSPTTSKIEVTDNFEVKDVVQDGGRRSMTRACAVGDSIGNVCVAEQVMRFRDILKKRDRNCLVNIPKVEFSPKAKEFWKENEVLMKAEQEKYQERIDNAEKECKERKLEPWECDRTMRRASSPKPTQFTKTQQNHINAIEGKEPLI
jgi:hypothetical protein